MPGLDLDGGEISPSKSQVRVRSMSENKPREDGAPRASLLNMLHGAYAEKEEEDDVSDLPVGLRRNSSSSSSTSSNGVRGQQNRLGSRGRPSIAQMSPLQRATAWARANPP